MNYFPNFPLNIFSSQLTAVTEIRENETMGNKAAGRTEVEEQLFSVMISVLNCQLSFMKLRKDKK